MIDWNLVLCCALILHPLTAALVVWAHRPAVRRTAEWTDRRRRA